MPRMEFLVRVDHEFGVREWFGDRKIGEEAHREIVRRFGLQPPYATLPYLWSCAEAGGGDESDGIGGGGVGNPLTIDVGLNLGPSEDTPVTYRVTLDELIDAFVDAISGVHMPDGRNLIVGKDAVRCARRMAGALRLQAEKIEALIAEAPEKPTKVAD